MQANKNAYIKNEIPQDIQLIVIYVFLTVNYKVYGLKTAILQRVAIMALKLNKLCLSGKLCLTE